MEKVTVIVEKASDGSFSCYAERDFGGFGLSGYGRTADEAKADMLQCLEEMREMEAAEGRAVPPVEFVYKYDIQSFFNSFPFLNVSKVAERAGISPSLMRQYSCGTARAGQKQYDKLRRAVRSIGSELSAAVL
jgi:hypothetical protein